MTDEPSAASAPTRQDDLDTLADACDDLLDVLDEMERQSAMRLPFPRYAEATLVIRLLLDRHNPERAR